MTVTKEEREELRRYYDSGRPGYPDPMYCVSAEALAIRLLDELEAAERYLDCFTIVKDLATMLTLVEAYGEPDEEGEFDMDEIDHEESTSTLNEFIERAKAICKE